MRTSPYGPTGPRAPEYWGPAGPNIQGVKRTRWVLFFGKKKGGGVGFSGWVVDTWWIRTVDLRSHPKVYARIPTPLPGGGAPCARYIRHPWDTSPDGQNFFFQKRGG